MPYLGNPAQQRFSSPRAASVYSGDGSTVAFTLEEVVTTDEDILVSVDGVIQEPSVAYAVSSGTTLTFTAAPSSNSGNNIFVYYIARTFGSVSMPDGQNVNASTLNTSGNVVHNEASADVDFRVESNDNANMLFVDGGNNIVSVGGSATTTAKPTFAIVDTTNGGIMTMRGQSPKIHFDVTSSGVPKILMDNAGVEFKSGTLDAEGNVNLKIDGNGIITKPLQPAFLAQPTSQQANIGEGSEIDIAFATERFDQNGDFASSVFTAPVTGKYFLSYSLWISNIDSVPSYFETYLTTSNRQYLHTFDPRGLAQDAGSRTINNALVADMDAGDTAKIQILIQSSGTVQSDVENYSFFSGYLVA